MTVNTNHPGKVTMIGLGSMGGALARALLSKGFEVTPVCPKVNSLPRIGTMQDREKFFPVTLSTLFNFYFWPMKEQLTALIDKLKDNALTFKEVLTFIETYYQHQPTAFKNGSAQNEATQNQGSAKVFAFAQLNNLSKEDTLYLFAEHYRAVLNDPNGTDHQNIRQFMIHGWPGVVFEAQP